MENRDSGNREKVNDAMMQPTRMAQRRLRVVTPEGSAQPLVLINIDNLSIPGRGGGNGGGLDL